MFRSGRRRPTNLGFDGVWSADNFFEKARVESTITLGGIAARTQKVKISTSSFIFTTRNVVWMALTWASLDQVSNGRMIMTVCVGGGSPRLGGYVPTRNIITSESPSTSAAHTWKSRSS